MTDQERNMDKRHLQVLRAAAEQIQVRAAPQNKGQSQLFEVVGVHASPVCPWAEAVICAKIHPPTCAKRRTSYTLRKSNISQWN